MTPTATASASIRNAALLAALTLSPLSNAGLLSVDLSLGQGLHNLSGELDTGDFRGIEAYPWDSVDYDYYYDVFQVTFTENLDVSISVTAANNAFIPWLGLFEPATFAVNASTAAPSRDVVWYDDDTGFDVYVNELQSTLGFSGTRTSGFAYHPAQLSFSATAGSMYQVVVSSFDYYSTDDVIWVEYYHGLTPWPYPDPVVGTYTQDTQSGRYILDAALGGYGITFSATAPPAASTLALSSAPVQVPTPTTWALLLMGLMLLANHRLRLQRIPL